MQNAKDTFYVTLQARLAALNPARTIVLRGVVRPGVLVTENELPTADVLNDTFRVSWTSLQIDESGPLGLATMECSIQYATAGNVDNGGMDRGRLLAGMDGELAAALRAKPRSAQTMNYSKAGTGTSPTAMGTTIFWADPEFSVARAAAEQVERTATVQVFAYQEAGEL
jgi:hypothetical protein